MKRLFLNTKERLQFFRNNPVYSIRSVARELTWVGERFLGWVTECKAGKGIASGVSPSYLVLATKKNRKGHLHSIEVDNSQVMLDERPPGWIVPESLRIRWSIHTRRSELILPDLLNDGRV